MSTVSGPLLVAIRLVSILVALAITATSYRAYRRTGEATFAYTVVGFSMVTLGLGIESLLLRTVPLTLTEIHTVESALFAAGFVVLYFSLRGRPGG